LESYFNSRHQRVQLLDEELNQNINSTWEQITDVVPEGSILGPLLFLIYINYLPKILNDHSIPILFADDTSILVKSSNPTDFQTNVVNTFNCAYKWFQINLLTININETHYTQFKTKNEPTKDINIVCKEYPITALANIKFLGIYLNNLINRNGHIEYIVPRLSSASYIMRSIKPYMSFNTLETIYYSYFNSVISYGLQFWGNSPHSLKIFRLQKKIIRIMIGGECRVSCRNLFRKLKILPLESQYIYSLMLFVVNNTNYFTSNSDNRFISTRQSLNFYRPNTNLTLFQKGVHYMGIKVFNTLPHYIKEISNNSREFESNLKRFLHAHSFYSIDEYFQYKSTETLRRTNTASITVQYLYVVLKNI